MPYMWAAVELLETCTLVGTALRQKPSLTWTEHCNLGTAESPDNQQHSAEKKNV